MPRPVSSRTIAYCAGCGNAICEGQLSRTIKSGENFFDVHIGRPVDCVASAEVKLGIRIPPREDCIVDHAKFVRDDKPHRPKPIREELPARSEPPADSEHQVAPKPRPTAKKQTIKPGRGGRGKDTLPLMRIAAGRGGKRR